MVDAAVETLREVDAVMLVHDASTRPGHGDHYVSKLLENVTIPVVLVLNKIDLVAKAKLLPVIEQLRQWREFADIVPVSAATGDGVETLERLLLEKMPEGPALYPEDYLTDQPQRVLVSETVREKVLHHTHDVKKPAICATDRRGAHRKPDHAPTLANETFLHRIKFELAGDLLAESFAIGIGVIRVRVGE